MLRVKKQKDSYALILPTKEKFFRKEVLFGLLFACLLHLIGFSIFHITVSPREYHLPLSPLHVEVDMGREKLAQAPFNLPLETFAPCVDPTPKLSLPSGESAFGYEYQDPDFSSIEVIDYESIYIDFDDDQD